MYWSPSDKEAIRAAGKQLEEVNLNAFAAKLNDREFTLTLAQLFDELHKEGTAFYVAAPA